MKISKYSDRMKHTIEYKQKWNDSDSNLVLNEVNQTDDRIYTRRTLSVGGITSAAPVRSA